MPRAISKLTKEKRKLFGEIELVVGLLNKYTNEDIIEFCSYYNSHKLEAIAYLREQYKGEDKFVSYYDRNKDRILKKKREIYLTQKDTLAKKDEAPASSSNNTT